MQSCQPSQIFQDSPGFLHLLIVVDCTFVLKVLAKYAKKKKEKRYSVDD